jgi:hypothetical protein
MKRAVLMIVGMICMQFISGQQVSGVFPAVRITADSADDSFILTPDTLWFLTGDDFVEGKPFQIINDHDYPIDILHIDQSGEQCMTCIAWYTVPGYPVYPVIIPPNSSITTLVKFYAIDGPGFPLVYDTLNVNTAGHAGHVIIAADSIMVQVGMAEPGKTRIIVAPNPFTYMVRVSLSGPVNEKVTLTVCDALLRPVKELYSGLTGPVNQTFLWNGTNQQGNPVSRGVYFITVRTASGQKTLRVVKA